MKTILLGFLGCALLAGVTSATASDAHGLKDACAAGALLEANHYPNEVVTFTDTDGRAAGCVFQFNGSQYLYTLAGSAKISGSGLKELGAEPVGRDVVRRYGEDNHDIRNGCLIFAVCAYHQVKTNSHVVWAGLIAADVFDLQHSGFGGGGGSFQTHGHAIVAYETDQREIYIQENGEDPKQIDRLTHLAQNGDKSWHDASSLIFYYDHTQALTQFAGGIWGAAVNKVFNYPTS